MVLTILYFIIFRFFYAIDIKYHIYIYLFIYLDTINDIVPCVILSNNNNNMIKWQY